MSTRVATYDASHEGAWRTFTEGHPERGLGHLAAALTYQTAAGATNRSVLVYDGEDVAAVLPLFEVNGRDLRYLRVRRLTSGTSLPAGPLFAPGFGAKRRKELLELLASHVDQEARARRATEAAVAYPALIAGRAAIDVFGYLPWRPYGFREHNVVALVSDIRRSEDALLKGLDSSARNKVRRCAKGGGEARVIESRDEWLRAYPLNVATLGPLAISRATMEQLWDLFVVGGHAVPIAVTVGDALASVTLISTVGPNAYYWFAFNAPGPSVPGTNALALWTGMLEAKRRGCEMFEIGSLEFENAKQIAIGRFKAQFGGTPVYVLGGTKAYRPARQLAVSALSLAASAVRARARRTRRDESEPAAPPDGTEAGA